MLFTKSRRERLFGGLALAPRISSPSCTLAARCRHQQGAHERAEPTMNLIFQSLLPLFLAATLGGSTSANGGECCPCCPPACVCAEPCCDQGCGDDCCPPAGCCDSEVVEAPKPAPKASCCGTSCGTSCR
jgi:hypothetical protein